MYCTEQDLIDRFDEQELINLTDENNLNIINTAKVEQAIEDASAEMDGYLAGRYELPLAFVPASLKPLCCNIARYKLHDEHATEQVTKHYDAGIKFLMMVSKGDISLGVDTNGERATSNDLAEFESEVSIFSRNRAKGFI